MIRLPDPELVEGGGDGGPPEVNRRGGQRKRIRNAGPPQGENRRNGGSGSKSRRLPDPLTGDRHAVPLRVVEDAPRKEAGAGFAEGGADGRWSRNHAATSEDHDEDHDEDRDGDRAGPERVGTDRSAGFEDAVAAFAAQGRAAMQICDICPVGILLATARDASPEVIDHLLGASKELVAAVRTVVVSLEDNIDNARAKSRVQRIKL